MVSHSIRPSSIAASVRAAVMRPFIALSPILASVALTSAAANGASNPPHPNPEGAADEFFVLHRADVVHLPAPLKGVLGQLARRPHTYNPMRVFAEADKPSQLFQYYLLDTTSFQPNVFTSVIRGINDGAIPTAANAANGQLPTIGTVRLALEPKPGLPTDPEDVEAFNDVFTDISGLFVINNESGWYEGWMIHDLVVPKVAPPRTDGHAQFNTMTNADAMATAAIGKHHNVPGRLFTIDGDDVRFPSARDHFPGHQSNLVPLTLSMGAYNCLQQSDCHSYWEFN